MKISEFKVGDIAGVRVDPDFGNARRICKNPAYPVKVTAVGRKWITVECKEHQYLSGRYEADTGCKEDSNDNVYLYKTYAEALMEARKGFMRREIRRVIGKIEDLSYAQVFEIYEILTENKTFIDCDIIDNPANGGINYAE